MPSDNNAIIFVRSVGQPNDKSTVLVCVFRMIATVSAFKMGAGVRDRLRLNVFNCCVYHLSREIFTEIFHFKHNLKEFNILTPQEFDNFINEIFQLMGYDWVSFINGELMLIGYSIEEKEEKEVFRYLKKYRKVIENLEKAKQHILEADWNSVPLYCCKAIEHFYKNLLGQKKEFEKDSISKLTQKIIEEKNINSLFKNSFIDINDGIKNLLQSGKNLVGTLRNRKDSAHGNPLDVEDWEARLSYSYTILLLKTLEIIKS